MAIAEYIYVDHVRLNSYFEQISSPKKYEKIPEWGVEFSITGPKAQGKQSRLERDFTVHEKIGAVVTSLYEQCGNRFPNVIDAVSRTAEGNWIGFALETLAARRLIFGVPISGASPYRDGDKAFRYIPLWVCEETTELSRADQPLLRFLMEDYPRKIDRVSVAESIFSSFFVSVFGDMRVNVLKLEKDEIAKGLKRHFLISNPTIGPIRTIDTLYRLRDRGGGEIYAYPIFIADHPSPFSTSTHWRGK